MFHTFEVPHHDFHDFVIPKAKFAKLPPREHLVVFCKRSDCAHTHIACTEAGSCKTKIFARKISIFGSQFSVLVGLKHNVFSNFCVRQTALKNRFQVQTKKHGFAIVLLHMGDISLLEIFRVSRMILPAASAPTRPLQDETVPALAGRSGKNQNFTFFHTNSPPRQ